MIITLVLEPESKFFSTNNFPIAIGSFKVIKSIQYLDLFGKFDTPETTLVIYLFKIYNINEEKF